MNLPLPLKHSGLPSVHMVRFRRPSSVELTDGSRKTPGSRIKASSAAHLYTHIRVPADADSLDHGCSAMQCGLPRSLNSYRTMNIHEPSIIIEMSCTKVLGPGSGVEGAGRPLTTTKNRFRRLPATGLGEHSPP